MPDVIRNNLTLTLAGTSGTTAPAAGTSQSWTVAALPAAAGAALGTGETLRLVDSTAGGSTAQQAEIVLLTAMAGTGATSVTVTRGVEGTTPVAHSTGATFAAVVTKAVFDGFPRVITVNPGDDPVAKVAAAPAGGTVQFSSGAYTLANPLVPVADGVALLALGNVTLTAPGVNGKCQIFAPIGRKSLTLAGFTLVGGAADLYGTGLLSLTNCDNATIRDNVTAGTGIINGAAILLTGCRQGKVLNNNITTPSYGIVVGSSSANGSRSSDYNLIDGNYIVGQSGGFDLIYSTASLGSDATTNISLGNRITRNTAIGSGDAGIECGVGTVGAVISDNVVSGAQGPNILLRDNVGTQVIGNRSTGNLNTSGSYTGGIAVLDQTAYSRDISIVGNYCEANAGPGIQFAPQSISGGGGLISGNYCRGNGQEGIWIGTSPGTAVTGNVCEGNAGYGIATQARGTGVSDGIISSNLCRNNTRGGIQLRVQNVVAVGNRCYDDRVVKVQPYGLLIHSSQANFLTIMGNDLSGNLTGAIYDDELGTGHTKFCNKGAASPTVTGSRGGNVALASLLTQLGSTGMLTDNST